LRSLAIIPLLVGVSIAVACISVRSAGFDPHVREMRAAALTVFAAAELAFVPLMLTRGGNQASVAQAALVGTGIHLFVSIVVAAVLILGHLGLGDSYLYWLLGLYWVTLIALVVAFAKAVRSAPVAPAK
jgi:hypothetical protein